MASWKKTWPLAYFLSLQDRVKLLSVIFTRANRNGRRKRTREGEKRVEIGRKERNVEGKTAMALIKMLRG